MNLKFWDDGKTNNLDNIDYPALKLACSRDREAQANDALEEQKEKTYENEMIDEW